MAPRWTQGDRHSCPGRVKPGGFRPCVVPVRGSLAPSSSGLRAYLCQNIECECVCVRVRVCVIRGILFVCLIGFIGVPPSSLMGLSHLVLGVWPSVRAPASCCSCEPDGVGKHRAQPHCVSGGAGDAKCRWGFVLMEFVPIMTVIMRDTSQAILGAGTRLSSRMPSLITWEVGGMNSLQKWPMSHSQEETSPRFDLRGIRTQSPSSPAQGTPNTVPGASPQWLLSGWAITQALHRRCPRTLLYTTHSG